MVYGAEAVLPADIAFRSAQIENFDKDKANEVRELEVNSVEEKWLDSCVRTAKICRAIQNFGTKRKCCV